MEFIAIIGVILQYVGFNHFIMANKRSILPEVRTHEAFGSFFYGSLVLGILGTAIVIYSKYYLVMLPSVILLLYTQITYKAKK